MTTNDKWLTIDELAGYLKMGRTKRKRADYILYLDALMTHCHAMEKARRHADHLLQVVLKEAFSPAGQQAPMEQNGETD